MLKFLIPLVLMLAFPTPVAGQKITIAAASDLKFAMPVIIADYQALKPGVSLIVVYGSSGQFCTQIQQGAPFDLFCSADSQYPALLVQKDFNQGPSLIYAQGKLVLWTKDKTTRLNSLSDLSRAEFSRIALANPQHAPYGQRAQEALEKAGLWTSLQKRLVFAENVAQAAQFVQSANAQAGFIALALAISPELSSQGQYFLIPQEQYSPLWQAMVVTKQSKYPAAAHDFAQYLLSPKAQAILRRYGFDPPPVED